MKRKMFLAACIGLALVTGDALARPRWSADEGEVIPLESVVLESVLYEDEARVLVVTFRNGASYEYYGVAREVFEGLLESTDKGRYYNAHIRSAYESRRIEDWASAGRP